MKKSKLPVIYGLGIAVLLILSFLTFAAFGLHTKPIYSMFNGVIMGVGMLLCLNAYKEEKGSRFNYQKGFTATFFSGFNATIYFTAFFMLYSGAIETDYIANMLGHWFSHYHTPQIFVVFMVFIMGMVTTLMLSLAYMQYYKDSWNTRSTKNTSIGMTDALSGTTS